MDFIEQQMRTGGRRPSEMARRDLVKALAYELLFIISIFTIRFFLNCLTFIDTPLTFFYQQEYTDATKAVYAQTARCSGISPESGLQTVAMDFDWTVYQGVSCIPYFHITMMTFNMFTMKISKTEITTKLKTKLFALISVPVSVHDEKLFQPFFITSIDSGLSRLKFRLTQFLPSTLWIHYMTGREFERLKSSLRPSRDTLSSEVPEVQSATNSLHVTKSDSISSLGLF